MPKVALTTLGCKVNQFETESMEGLFKKKGYEIVPFDQPADFYIINTGGTNAATVTANTGCTLVGVAAVSANSACGWRVCKTANATYVFYRIAG